MPYEKGYKRIGIMNNPKFGGEISPPFLYMENAMRVTIIEGTYAELAQIFGASVTDGQTVIKPVEKWRINQRRKNDARNLHSSMFVRNDSRSDDQPTNVAIAGELASAQRTNA